MSNVSLGNYDNSDKKRVLLDKFCVVDYQNRGLLVVENSNFADLIFFLKLVYLIWRIYLPIQNVN